MKIKITYFAQIRKKAGVESETVDVAHGATVLAALKTLKHGDEFKSLLFDESGALRPVILLVVNEVPVAPDHKLNDGDCVQVFSPVAGG
ncbi:MAG: MoaD/ThiS family protein [Kiritimatiellaceae bacterium]|nr:MoaD/ThiS family protein [Kiritimatiellaceae bacterium]